MTTTRHAFVLLSESRLPEADALANALLEVRPGENAIRPIIVGESAESIELAMGSDQKAIVALAPIPIPTGEATEAARYSVSAIGTGWELKDHVAHLIVTWTSKEPRRVVQESLTSLLAAVVMTSPAVGVYWGDARATHDPDFFVSVAMNPDALMRLALWTGVSVAREATGHLSLLSLGMDQFDLPDLLLVVPESSGNDAIVQFFDLLGYVVERGEPLPEGDTIGFSESQRWVVNYVPSPIDPATQVWTVRL